jgi:hypothetical protein
MKSEWLTVLPLTLCLGVGVIVFLGPSTPRDKNQQSGMAGPRGWFVPRED